jgi:hypothetical protein
VSLGGTVRGAQVGTAVETTSNLHVRYRSGGDWREIKPGVRVPEDLRSVTLQFGGEVMEVSLSWRRRSITGVRLASAESGGQTATGCQTGGSPIGPGLGRSTYVEVSRNADSTNGMEYSGDIHVYTGRYVLAIDASPLDMGRSPECVGFSLSIIPKAGISRKDWKGLTDGWKERDAMIPRDVRELESLKRTMDYRNYS